MTTTDPYIAARQLRRRLETLQQRAAAARDKACADAADSAAAYAPETLAMVLATADGRALAEALGLGATTCAGDVELKE